MSFPPMRYNEAEELYRERPIEPKIGGLLALFYSAGTSAESQLGYSVGCAQANSQVMGDLYEELVPMGLDIAFDTEQVGVDAVADLVHKAMAFGEAKMLARITLVAQMRALEGCPPEGNHAN